MDADALPRETLTPAPGAPVQATRPPGAKSATAAAQDRRWVLWVILVFVLVALAVAAIWFWPEIRSRARLLTGPDETITVDAGTADAGNSDARAAIEALPGALDVAEGTLIQEAATGDGVGDALPDGRGLLDPAATALPPRPASAPIEAAPKPPIEARALATDDDPPAPRTGLGESPAPGVALLPPRVSGLDARLVEAIAGRDTPIDPQADAWTFVVLSTTSRAEAEALRDRYRRAGYRSSVLTSRGGQFRVCVGQFASRDDVFRLRDRLPPQAPADTWALYLQTL